jgi:hypothetical protein
MALGKETPDGTELVWPARNGRKSIHQLDRRSAKHQFSEMAGVFITEGMTVSVHDGRLVISKGERWNWCKFPTDNSNEIS